MKHTATDTLISTYNELTSDITALVNDQHPFNTTNHNREVDQLSSLKLKIWRELRNRGIIL